MSSSFGSDRRKSSSSVATCPQLPTRSTGVAWFGGVGVQQIDGRVSRLDRSPAAPQQELIPVLQPRSPAHSPSRAECLPLRLPSLNREWANFPRSHIVDLEMFEFRARHTAPQHKPDDHEEQNMSHDPPQIGVGNENDTENEVSRERKRDKLKAFPSKLVRRIRA